MTRNGSIHRAAAAFLAVAVSTVPGAAGSCGYEFCWGAVAVGKNGSASRSSGQRTAPDAVARAMTACGENCVLVEPFVNGCGAIAQSFERTLFSGFADDADGARAEAMALCEANSKYSCRIRVQACSQ